METIGDDELTRRIKLTIVGVNAIVSTSVWEKFMHTFSPPKKTNMSKLSEFWVHIYLPIWEALARDMWVYLINLVFVVASCLVGIPPLSQSN